MATVVEKLRRTEAYGERGTLADKLTSVNAYADADHVHVMGYGNVRFGFSAAANALKVQILGSIDGGATYPFTVEPEFTIATGTPVTKSIAGPYSDLKIQVKPSVNDAHGTLSSTYLAG